MITPHTWRLGAVSFLNTLPLVDGLADDARISLRYAVPSALPELLHTGQVDASLVPVIDVARSRGAWQRVGDACIGSDGLTLTVRVFSKVPAEQIDLLHVDGDSHTSVALARVIWSHVYGRDIEQARLPAGSRPQDCRSVLLIGDKVVTTPMPGFEHQVDLGEAWKRWTGLPCVFAGWAGPPRGGLDELGASLGQARDRGVAKAAELAARGAPGRNWPIDIAVDYLTRKLMFKLDARGEQGIARFFELAGELGLTAPLRGEP